MDWETFFQGVKDTRTGGGLFVVALLLVLLGAIVLPVFAEGVCALWFALWSLLGAVVVGVLNLVSSMGFLEVASFAARGTLFLSSASLAALALIITHDRFQRSTRPVSVPSAAAGAPSAERGLSQTAARRDSPRSLRVGATRAPFWLRPRRAGPDQIRRAPTARHPRRDPGREES